MTRTECRDKAVEDFEALLLAAGWTDSYGMTATELAAVRTPLFTRLAVSTNLAATANRTAYMQYRLTDDLTTDGFSDNISGSGKIFIDYQIYTNDPFFFDDDLGTNRHFLIDIERLGEERGWSVNFNSDQITQETELAQLARYQSHYTAVKRYNNLMR